MIRKVTIINRQQVIVGQEIVQTLWIIHQLIKTQFYTLTIRLSVMLILMATLIIYILIVIILKRISTSLRFLSNMILNLAMSISTKVSDLDPQMTPT